jgi:flagellar biosynthesis protein
MTDGINITDSEEETPKKPSVAKAVALKHERGEGIAPHIIASGKGAIAEQILEIAFSQGIKVREDADLTELLTQLDIDSPIPLEAYAAVAEILAYVYKANADYGSRKGTL